MSPRNGRTSSTRTSPRVSVPVLSHSTCVARASVSNASECATSTPRVASADGRGRERGRCRERQRARARHDQHGQRRRERLRRIDEPPGHEHDGGTDQDAAQEPGGGAIGRLGESRPLGLRSFEQRDDAGQHRLARDGRDSHAKRCAEILRARVHARAALLGDGCRFTRQHRLVDASVGRIDHGAVGSEHFSRAHEDVVTRLQFNCLHVLDLGVPHASRGHGRKPGERIGDAAGAMPRDHLDVAAEREEEHEHGDRVE